jgi:hypothetical protein
LSTISIHAYIDDRHECIRRKSAGLATANSKPFFSRFYSSLKKERLLDISLFSSVFRNTLIDRASSQPDASSGFDFETQLEFLLLPRLLSISFVRKFVGKEIHWLLFVFQRKKIIVEKSVGKWNVVLFTLIFAGTGWQNSFSS